MVELNTFKIKIIKLEDCDRINYSQSFFITFLKGRSMISKGYKKIILALTLGTFTGGTGSQTVLAADFINTLTPYKKADLQVVNTVNTYQTAPKYGYAPNGKNGGLLETKANVFKSTNQVNHPQLKFKTQWFLQASLHSKRDAANPQAFVFSPNNRYIYVLYSLANNQGFIIRYSVAGLNQLNKKGLNYLRKTASYNLNYQTVSKSAFNKRWHKAYLKDTKKILKVGKRFTIGHGQALNFNPKTHELFLLQDKSMSSSGKAWSKVVRISLKTLAINGQVRFKLQSNVPMGHVLTFDNKGRAYFVTQSSPNHQLKIYQGTLGLKQVQFHLVKQVLAYGVGEHVQSLSYNAQTNRLNVLADNSLLTIPVAKLGQLQPSDIEQFVFKTNREFETMQYDKAGNGYLMVNRGVEILKLNTQTK